MNVWMGIVLAANNCALTPMTVFTVGADLGTVSSTGGHPVHVSYPVLFMIEKQGL